MCNEIMTIAEGLAELKRIAKLLPKKFAIISKYSSKMQANPDTIKNQEQYVAEQKQSILDLLERYKRIKLAIEQANLNNYFEFNGKKYSVREALLYKHYLFALYERLYDSFNDNEAKKQISEMRISSSISAEQLIKMNMVPKLYYDERQLQKEKEELLLLMSKIDALIDMVNHSNNITI